MGKIYSLNVTFFENGEGKLFSWNSGKSQIKILQNPLSRELLQISKTKSKDDKKAKKIEGVLRSTGFFFVVIE